MKPKVSVVVAAYNVEKYIERCLQSLANQTLREIEILVINDGSKDRTEEIAKKFEEKDSRFKVITQENGGLSAARNTGIKNARADYIAFLDGDDYVNVTMYEKLYSKIIHEQSDLAICGFVKVWEDADGIELKRKKYKVNKKLLNGDIIGNFLTKQDEPFVVAWNKLFKKNIIKTNSIYFENRAFFEDVGFIPRYLFYSKKIVVVNQVLHYYVQRSGSITKKYNPIIEESARNTLSLLNNFFNSKELLEKYKEDIKQLETRLLIYIINKKIKHNKDISEDVKKLRSLSCKKIPFKHKIGVYLMQNFRNLYIRLLLLKKG
jgi:glycosyltransferase involved in cell wall biosynthesis